MNALRKEKLPLAFKAQAIDNTLTLEIYDVIGADMFGAGITASNVSAALSGGDYDSITVRLNSPGGDAFEGVAIYNILKNSGKTVNVVVDGLAASSASIIAMAGDNIDMGEGSMLMIHDAMALAFGNAAELSKMAKTLDQVSASIADIYVSRTGMKKSEVKDLMSAETWMNAKDAKKNGFANSVKGVGKIGNAFDLSIFQNTPDELKNIVEEEVVAEVVPVAVVEPEILEPVVEQADQDDFSLYMLLKQLEIAKRK